MGTMASINKACTTVEVVFNAAGSLPITPIISAPIRSKLGVIQFLAGGITALGATIGEAIESNRSNPNPETLVKMQRLRKFGAQHAIHGVLNVLRALGEFIIGVTTLGFGNLVTYLPFNLMRNPRFAPYHGYLLEPGVRSSFGHAHAI